jgi:hypothetical protein
MSDETLTIAAVVIELGVPLVALFLYWRLPAYRPKLIVVLAGLTPALVFYVAVTVAYVANPTEPNNRFAFFAGWFMTLAAYMAVLVVGIALSFLPKPSHLFARYLLGLLPSIAAAVFLLR